MLKAWSFSYHSARFSSLSVPDKPVVRITWHFDKK